MANSENIKFPFIAEGTAGFITANVAFALLDIMVRGHVTDRLTAQPGSPVDGQVWILTGSPTGAQWGSRSEHDIAIFYSGWHFFVPKEGWVKWVEDENTPYRFDGSSWIVGSLTSIVSVGDGAVGAPSYTFTSDLLTGLYKPSGNTVGVTLAGVQRMLFDATQAVLKTSNGLFIDIAMGGGTGAGLKIVDSIQAGVVRIDSDGTIVELVEHFRPGSGNTYDLGTLAGKFWRHIYALTVRLQDGTVGAPSHSFEDDIDCGMFRIAVNQVGHATGGVLATQHGADQSFTTKDALQRKLTRNTIADVGTITVTQVRDGIVEQDASGGSVTMITPIGTALDTEFTDLSDGESLDLYHVSNHASNTSTISGGTGVTVVGSAAVTQIGGQYKLIKTGTATYDLVRVG